MQIPKTSPRYCAFLLRCWEERLDPSGPGTWRYTLEEVAGGERHGFASLEVLIAYLKQRLEETHQE